jgi:hypothetical protein
MDIKGYMINPERLHIRMVDKPLDIQKEDLFSGIQIDSSDVGRSQLMIQFFVYKLVCTNGMATTKDDDMLYAQRHYSIRKETFKKGFIEALKRIPEIVVGMTEQINLATKTDITEIDSDHNEQLAKLSIATGLQKEIIESGLKLMEDHYNPTLWGVINGLTEAAQRYTLSTRLDIEKRASGILKLVA